MPTHAISVDGNPADNTGDAPSGSPYLSYVAMLNQIDEDAPVATVLNANDNNFLGNIIWTRGGAGQYNGTLTSAFIVGKTFMQISQSDQGYNCITYLGRVDANTLYINIYNIHPDNPMQMVDDALVDNVIEVRVYQN